MSVGRGNRSRSQDQTDVELWKGRDVEDYMQKKKGRLNDHGTYGDNRISTGYEINRGLRDPS